MLPFRAKNPPEHFPLATIGLIAVNILVFGLTSQNFISIRPAVVEQYAVSHSTLNVQRMLTAMFLHNDFLHLAGNMLFLWIFGASVEGRIRPWFYLPAYLIAGFGGDLLHEAFMGTRHPDQFSLGASGAIMGVAGMYFYMFPYSLIQAVHREYWVVGWMRVSDIQARWVIFYFIGFDLLYQLVFRGADGVGHLTHLGGFAAGFLTVLIMRARRDNEDVSNVQAVRAEMKDYSLLSFNDLSTLMQQPTEDMALVAAYCEKSLSNSHGARPDYCYAVVSQYQTPLIEQADPERLAWIVLSLHPSYGSLPPVYYLRLASRLESRASNDYACRLYQRVYELNPSAPETETALYRWGSLLQRAFNNPQQAQAIFNELFRLFPYGEMAEYARRTAGVR